MKPSIKEPIPEIFAVWKNLSAAVNFHLAGDFVAAESHFRAANCATVWRWLNPAWVAVHLNVMTLKPENDTQLIPKSERDPDRNISKEVKAAVLQRDGYQCRYCGIPVVHADIRKIAHKIYPDAVPWDSLKVEHQHAGFQALWLQYDHVEPHSHGGRSTADNVVITCALCNFGKDKYTLRQLNVADPRHRPIVCDGYNGLERFRQAHSK